MGITTALLSLATAASGAWNRYQERKQAEHEVIIAKDKARKDIALETIKAEIELGKVQIKATKPWFKYITFFLWFGPFLVSTIFPSYGIMIFDNLKLLPEWYVQSCMTIMFAIWGIQVSRETIAGIVLGISKHMKERKTLKLNRQLFYDVLRSSNGPLTQEEVHLYEKALNALNKKD